MKIQETQTKKLTITDVQGMDAIAVYLEDHAPGIGKITITCYGDSWTAFWAHMGEKETIKSFFCGASNSYLIEKLSPRLESTEIDYNGMDIWLKKRVIAYRKNQDISKEEAREFWDQIEDYDNCSMEEFINNSRDSHDLLYRVVGDEWWYELPRRQNPQYTRLDRIVSTVKDALALPEQQEAA